MWLGVPKLRLYQFSCKHTYTMCPSRDCCASSTFNIFFSLFVLFFYHVSCVVDQLKLRGSAYAALRLREARHPPFWLARLDFTANLWRNCDTALFLSYDFHFLTFELQQYWIINIIPVIYRIYDLFARFTKFAINNRIKQMEKWINGTAQNRIGMIEIIIRMNFEWIERHSCWSVWSSRDEWRKIKRNE